MRTFVDFKNRVAEHLECDATGIHISKPPYGSCGGERVKLDKIFSDP